MLVITTADTHADTDDPVSGQMAWYADNRSIYTTTHSKADATQHTPTDTQNAACTWCRFLSCIPTSSNNQCKGTVSRWLGEAALPRIV